VGRNRTVKLGPKPSGCHARSVEPWNTDPARRPRPGGLTSPAEMAKRTAPLGPDAQRVQRIIAAAQQRRAVPCLPSIRERRRQRSTRS